jgi:hypothetical protein
LVIDPLTRWARFVFRWRFGCQFPNDQYVTKINTTTPENVAGQVVDAKTGRPVAGAIVSISGQQRKPTNQTENFALANLSPGRVEQIEFKFMLGLLFDNLYPKFTFRKCAAVDGPLLERLLEARAS